MVLWGAVINAISAYLAFSRLKTMKTPTDLVNVRVTIVLPVTGNAVDMTEIVRRLERQTLRPAHLIVAVESEADPAFAIAKEALAKTGIAHDIVVAGLAERQAQKCLNLQAAIRQGHGDDGYLVFMDADIRPSIHWLLQLILPLSGGNFDLVNGRRWLMPSKSTFGSHVVAMIDRSIMLLPRMDFVSTCTIWGGSIALSFENARALDLHGCLDNTISDDLAIARQAKLKQMRIVAPGSLLVASPIDLTIAQAWRFARRQYQICRLHRPMLWYIAMSIVIGRLAAWAAAFHLLALGYGPLPILALAGTGLLKQVLVARVAGRCNMADATSGYVLQLMLGLLQPVADMFHLSVLLSVSRVKRLRWGHVTYRMNGPDEVFVVGRASY